MTNVVNADTRRTYGFEDFDHAINLRANTRYAGSPSRVDANGSGTETSSITGSRIQASVTAFAEGVAEAPGARGYATGNADFYLTFQLARRVRYVVSGDGQAYSDAQSTSGGSRGGSASLLYIANLESGVPLLSIDIGNTDADSVQRRGWAPAGPYTLQGDVSALVEAKDVYSASAFASWNLDFQAFCAADYDTNGSVNALDRDAFLNAWNARSLEADIDGNRTVDTADRTMFLLAFGSGC
ncbi:hypothetical protein HPC49_10685 [Pyxidicoccus fallax]|uniref:Uncharacterized protein n=1 Tax=Pyxidicoccus fallax TaxID=394095 RepID=A0A848LD49_9BACT|nr:hypothetical protein [Pyxidicoccus fallax]NPC78707.1 hypothetical protein [Pyxidicoccus fallax]